MIGRRSAALLCVLLAHAWIIHVLLSEFSSLDVLHAIRGGPGNWSEVIETEPIYVADLPPPPPGEDITVSPVLATPGMPAPGQGPELPAESTGITSTDHVDWPVEGKKAAARVLAREAEAERVARMFAGPGGTWASLTKRQRSKLNKFRWKAGVLGLEYDSQGNQIYHISDGCVIVNSMFFACAIGKPKVHDDMFENMRLYFDEQRLPQTDEGNGTEPEALRPPY
jgi:hypothetical protein